MPACSASSSAVSAARRSRESARDAALQRSSAGRALAEEVRRLEVAAAGVAVSGPGVVVTLDDADLSGDDADNRITDADLQTVVNALWAAGAEAVSVNDRRVGPLTAIREAGGVVLVDYRHVTPPYVVRAVGDPDLMEPAFAESPAALRLRTYVEAFGLRFDVERAKRLDLPSSETSKLRHARPGDPTPKETP